MPLTQAYLADQNDSPESVSIGAFLLRHWSRRRPLRQQVLAKLCLSQCPQAHELLWQWLQHKLEKHELRVEVARALMPHRPQPVLVWLVTHARWSESAPTLAAYPAAEVLGAMRQIWMWRAFDTLVADRLSQALGREVLLAELETLLVETDLRVARWALSALCRLRAERVIRDFQVWLNLPHTPLAQAAIEGLGYYPPQQQARCLALALNFRSGPEHPRLPYLNARFYEQTYWEKALRQAFALGQGPALKASLLNLLPLILGLNPAYLTPAGDMLRLTLRLLVQDPDQAVTEGLLAVFTSALSAPMAPVVALMVLDTLNQSWPDWLENQAQVLAWLEMVLTRARERAGGDSLELIHSDYWLFTGLLTACLRRDWPDLLPPLLQVWAGLQPWPLRPDYQLQDSYHFNVCTALLNYFRPRADTETMMSLLADIDWQRVLPDSQSDTAYASNYERVYQDILYVTIRGDQRILERLLELQTRARALQLARQAPEAWNGLNGAIASLRHRLATKA